MLTYKCDYNTVLVNGIEFNLDSDSRNNAIRMYGETCFDIAYEGDLDQTTGKHEVNKIIIKD